MILRTLASLAFLIIFLSSAAAADWPTWRADAERSGYTEEALPEGLQLQWSRKLPHVAKPAWPRSDRMKFDRAYPIISAEGKLYFGSSVECSIHALDAETGSDVWTFPTRAPVRFAPAYHKGQIFATSDDGFLYCLDAADGSLIWKKRGGPSDEMILGNGRMVSRWPARGGVVIRDDIVYFAAGIWPSDGVALYALDPESGETLWVNDTAGSIYMGQPHGGAFAKSGVAAQGYLLASDERIFMATGRAVPASFDRESGEFQFLSLQANTRRGGAEVVLSDRFFINSGYAFEQTDGALGPKIGVGPVVMTPDGLVGAFGAKLARYRWADKETVDRKGEKGSERGLEELSSTPINRSATSAIVAANQAVLGLMDEIIIVNLDDQEKRWASPVQGVPRSLAVANGKLFASSDEGVIYCFGTGEQTRHPPVSKPAPETAQLKTAEEIVRKGKITTGYGVQLGVGDGKLVYSLANTTDLFIYCVEPDAAKLAAARKMLTAFGLYGSRVMLLEGALDDTQLPDYFANLVIADEPSEEARRLMRPWGGTLITGELPQLQVEVRGPLEGAGQWTHQYADPSNSVNSGDELIQGPLGMLWFSDLQQPMTQRHGRGPAPLFQNGVLYSEGLDNIIAVDAYNGHQLWKYDLPGILDAYDGDHLMGTSGTGSNYCVSEDSVYVRRDNHCLRIDAKTGELIAEFEAPGDDVIWGYLAYEDGFLVGSIADPEHVPTYRYRPGGDMSKQLTESKTIFVLDAITGELVWKYDAAHSIRNNAIAIGNRALVLIDRQQAQFDRTREGKPDETNHPDGELIAFDLATGEVLWKNDKEIYGTVAAISEEHHAVMMSYQPTSFRLASEVGGRISVFDLSSGEHKWTQAANYRSRPLLNKDTIYAQGGAWDVLTGAERPFNFARSYGCGILAGSRNLMVYRSATLGYFDLTRNEENEDYGGIRPGCWINVIPAGGLVFAPDGSAGCSCSYLNQSWIALQSYGLRAPQMEADTFSDPKEVVVRLIPDAGDPQLRYTLDGSSPTDESPIYHSPIRVTESAMLRARAFSEKGRPSPPVDREILIDPDLIPLGGEQWTAHNGEWKTEGGVLIQSSNFGAAPKPTLENTPDVERPGALYILDSESQFSDGELTFEIRSEDNDALGFVFGYQDPQTYYLWSISAERPYRALALKNGDDYQVLGGVHFGYAVKKWHSVRLVIDGPKISGYFDGEEDFSVDLNDFNGGKIGFYSWANSGSQFRNLRFKAN